MHSLESDFSAQLRYQVHRPRTFSMFSPYIYITKVSTSSIVWMNELPTERIEAVIYDF